MNFKLKDPGSAITHFIGMLLALFAAFPLLYKASAEHGSMHLTTLALSLIHICKIIEKKSKCKDGDDIILDVSNWEIKAIYEELD